MHKFILMHFFGNILEIFKPNNFLYRLIASPLVLSLSFWEMNATNISSHLVSFNLKIQLHIWHFSFSLVNAKAFLVSCIS